MAFQQLPSTHRALVLNSTKNPVDITIKDQAVPTAGPGSTVIRVLAAPVLSYSQDVFSGTRPYPYPEPFVPGHGAVGRIVATGPDTTRLETGQLVFVEGYVHGRDDSNARAIFGLHSGFTSGSKKLLDNEWHDGTWAEYCKAPLETCHPLDEQRLLGSPDQGGLGYKIEDIVFLGQLIVPFGGLSDINLRPGEKVVVAPATGAFGSAAVRVALALGASQVVAMGRNPEALKNLEGINSRVSTVPITGEVAAEAAALQKHGQPDVYFDISPPSAAKSTHFQSVIKALRIGGRVSLMGSPGDDVSMPLTLLMHKCIQVKGKWMYERQDVKDLIRLVETGIVKLGPGEGMTTTAKFGLEQYQEAFDVAAANAGPGQQTLFVP